MTALTQSPEPDPYRHPTSLEDILEAARHRIEVTDTELKAARQRRDMLSAVLRTEFPGSSVYVNGSIAHGDALDPLTDVDLGVIVAEAVDTHGPGKKGCSDLQERAANAIKSTLRPEFENLRVEYRSRKRSILVRFGDPVTAGQDDFTADVIIAIDNTDADDNRGLWIPRYTGWDRSAPQAHTRMVRDANAKSVSKYAQTVRLLKHWNRANSKPLCSWNIKALALDVLKTTRPLVESLTVWFDHAIAALRKGLTEDPAGVATKPIGISEKMTRTEVVRRLEKARRHLTDAIALERDGYITMAHEALAKMFNDPEMLPFPDADRVRVEAATKFQTDIKNLNTRATKPVSGVSSAAPISTGVNVGTSGRPSRDVRSWSDRKNQGPTR
jgi:hypothetical protein